MLFARIDRGTLRVCAALVLGMVLTFVMAAALPGLVPSNYQATARLLLLLPPDARTTTTNPFLDQPNGLVVLSRVVAEAPSTDASEEMRRALALTSQFEVAIDYSQPIVTVSVEGDNPVDVIETRDWVVAVLELELLEVQQQLGAPASQTASAHIFMAEGAANRIVGDSSRATIGLVVAGALLTLVCAAALRHPRDPAPPSNESPGR